MYLVQNSCQNSITEYVLKGNWSEKHSLHLKWEGNQTRFLAVLQVAHPDRYVECYIAEQNLVGVGIGCATRDRTVAFCSTFAAFFTRAFDQLRMGAISQTNLNCAGSHAGISIGKAWFCL